VRGEVELERELRRNFNTRVTGDRSTSWQCMMHDGRWHSAGLLSGSQRSCLLSTSTGVSIRATELDKGRIMAVSPSGQSTRRITLKLAYSHPYP
jgi:hypothetical protein